MKVEILKNTGDVRPYVDLVRQSADDQRIALGFLPSRVYMEAAEQEKLLVAVVSSNGEKKFAGYVLFGGVFPHCRIFQVLVSEKFRRLKVGRKLVQAVVRRAQSESYLDISARVAEDLKSANQFWGRMGFKTIRSRQGGASRRRLINIRVRDLETPNLFNFVHPPIPDEVADFHLVERLARRTPLYVIDLNVLFDVVRKRLRSEQAAKVIRAGFRNLLRLAVTEEFIAELNRTTTGLTSDPVLKLALQLDRLPEPPTPEIDSIVSELSNVIFPERASRGGLSVQDKSDLLHVASAIYHKAAGFITSEKKILRAHEWVRSKYGIDVIGVGELSETVDIDPTTDLMVMIASLKGENVSARELVDENLSETEKFLELMYVPRQLQVDALSSGGFDSPRRRIQLTTDHGEVVVFASWNSPVATQREVEIFICADEDHPAAEAAVEYIIDYFCADTSRSGPALVRLRELPGHSLTRQIAFSHGFRGVGGRTHSGSNLQKICVGRVVDKGNWAKVRAQLIELVGIKIPKDLPKFEDEHQAIPIQSPRGDVVRITLIDLETLLSPVLLLFSSRGGVMVPIQQQFVGDLLGASPQLSLLSSPEAILLKERAYFSSPRTAKVLTEGVPLLFYESGTGGGRKCVIAAGRIRQTRVIGKTDIETEIERKGVLTTESLDSLISGSKVAVTTFDNIMHFENPVSLRRLREIGYVDKSNFRTARQISSVHLLSILEEGKAYGRAR